MFLFVRKILSASHSSAFLMFSSLSSPLSVPQFLVFLTLSQFCVPQSAAPQLAAPQLPAPQCLHVIATVCSTHSSHHVLTILHSISLSLLYIVPIVCSTICTYLHISTIVYFTIFFLLDITELKCLVNCYFHSFIISANTVTC